MADTAADVPSKFDLIINGHGYVFLDSLEESIPFRTHRADYTSSPPFVERQNVSNTYGDNAQDFFLTDRQRDWSLGEQQKYFRSGVDGRYWQGLNVDVSTPGQVSLSRSVSTLTFAQTVITGARANSTNTMWVAGSTNLYKVDQTGAITDLGAHGLGTTPARFGAAADGTNIFFSNGSAANVRKWNGTAFSNFSATPADSLAFVNNTLYGLNYSAQTLIQYDTAGVGTTLFTWKTADGLATGISLSKIEAFGGKILILIQYGQDVGAELWIYDGTGCQRLEVFPGNYEAYDLEVLYGVAYVSGEFFRPGNDATTRFGRPAVHFYDGSIGLLWQANDFSQIPSGTGANQVALAVVDGKLLFTDDTTSSLMTYNPALGGVSTVGSYTVASDQPRLIGSGDFVVYARNQATAYFYPAYARASSGYVVSSLIDFESSLPKVFRSIRVDFDAASDGNGGSVDIAYQADSVTGSWTTLQTGAVSGTEYTLPTTATGHALAVKVTLNKGTSTAGPVLRDLNVKAAPQLPIYPKGTYILDCTATEEAQRELRDGSFHPLTGYEMVQNLVTAKNSATPISVTDKVNGTYTGIVDVNDPEGWDVYEIHPSPENPTKAGSYVVRLTVRGV